MTAKPMLVLGLMSGTSADGIDVALARISGAPPQLNPKLLGHTSFSFPLELRKEILRVADQQPISAGALSRLNFRLGEIFAEAALAACRRFRISPKRVSLLGSHGQTIFHQGQPSPVFAFDTGPANMLIDALVQHFTRGHQRFDKDARLAQSGRSIRALLNELMKDPYLKLTPPKSTGREYYGRSYIEKIIRLGRSHRAKPADLIRAATIFTALSVVDALHRFVLRRTKIHQLIVSGGGARNPLIVAQLSAALRGSSSRPIGVLPSSSYR